MKARADLALDISTELVEYDSATFTKDVAPLFKPALGRIELSVAINLRGDTSDLDRWVDQDTSDIRAMSERLIKKGRLIQRSSSRYPNAKESIISVRRMVHEYANPESQAAGTPEKNPIRVFEGYRLSVVPVVSADRRFTRLKLTERSTQVTGLKKRSMQRGLGAAPPPIVITSPDLKELGRTATVETEDCGAIVFRLEYSPKGKVWVVLVRTTIFIQAEEDINNAEIEKRK